MQRNITSELNYVLIKFNIGINAQNNFVITEKTLFLNKELSNAINNYIWPPVKERDVYHYTSHAQSILTSQRFRLNCIAKNYTSDEVQTFCNTHLMEEWLKDDSYKEDMVNTYIGCFANLNITLEEESKLWRNFAANDGVRLKFRITSINEDFRKIKYEELPAKQIEILQQLNSIAQKYSLKLLRQRLTTLSAFYLPAKKYGYENEYRISYRVWSSSNIQTLGVGADSYIELPINQDTAIGFRLDLLEYYANSKPEALPAGCVYSSRF